MPRGSPFILQAKGGPEPLEKRKLQRVGPDKMRKSYFVRGGGKGSDIPPGGGEIVLVLATVSRGRASTAGRKEGSLRGGGTVVGVLHQCNIKISEPVEREEASRPKDILGLSGRRTGGGRTRLRSNASSNWKISSLNTRRTKTAEKCLNKKKLALSPVPAQTDNRRK